MYQIVIACLSVLMAAEKKGMPWQTGKSEMNKIMCVTPSERSFFPTYVEEARGDVSELSVETNEPSNMAMGRGKGRPAKVDDEICTKHLEKTRSHKKSVHHY